jgi:cupin 2 domain-containing protein
MNLYTGNLLDFPYLQPGETFDNLLFRPGLRIERIISRGDSTPAGEWFDQSWDEWVLLIKGEAGLLIAGEQEPRHLRQGDHLLLTAGCRHRVEWTDQESETIWLAVHIGEPSGEKG